MASSSIAGVGGAARLNDGYISVLYDASLNLGSTCFGKNGVSVGYYYQSVGPDLTMM